MSSIDKAIVTNRSILRSKYGAGYSQVMEQFEAWIAADALRGIVSVLIHLDDAEQMAKLPATPVTQANNPLQNKLAVDSIFIALKPAYLVIIGGLDVVPHQDLSNPAYSETGDQDQLAYGDLPYACDVPYSNDVADFVGPTRVVGRIPDLTGGTDPNYLIGLLRTAATYQCLPASEFMSYLAVSTDVWAASTAESLQKVFGHPPTLRRSPPDGPAWSSTDLSPLIHYFNCHGASNDWHYYGQIAGKVDGFPVAHDAGLSAPHLRTGCILVTECCYGAELYSVTGSQKPGIANVYLGAGGWAVFGSSTICYGPADGNSGADLICQYFLRHLLAGASLGRAALQARQQYVQDFTDAGLSMTAVDLKTLGQFNLLGDPSLQPVRAIAKPDLPSPGPALNSGPASEMASKTVPVAAHTAEREDRHRRREHLRGVGNLLRQTNSSVRSHSKRKASPRIAEYLRAILRESGAELSEAVSHDVSLPTLNPDASLFDSGIHPIRTIHSGVGLLPPGASAFRRLVAVAMTEEAGILKSQRSVFSH